MTVGDDGSAATTDRLRWTDNHCHLPEDPGEVTAVLAEAQASGVERLINVGVDLATSRRAIALANEHPMVAATVGLHPHDARDGTDGLAELAADPACAAIGECGFDFHYDHSPRDVQRDVFAEQVALANQLDKALVIHTRDAWEETFAVLDAEGMPARTVFHCFTGGPEEAVAGLDRGAFLSFSGIVTFKTADDLRAAAEITPLARLLVETDSPYLAPVPHRGRPNRPALVGVIGEFLAALTGRSVEAVAQATWDNATACYQL